jgi:peptidoglycan/LPS O-acetylase OafA/YrhL
MSDRSRGPDVLGKRRRSVTDDADANRKRVSAHTPDGGCSSMLRPLLFYAMAQKIQLDALTGLRGVAALTVVAAHYFVWCAPYLAYSSPKAVQWFFGMSDYGMTLFFTLSGFVITYNYFDFGWGHSPVRSFGRFVFLRFSRLYPALLIFLLALCLPKIGSEMPIENLTTWTILHLFSAQSWTPAKLDGMLPIDGMYHVSWSISAEFMLYFIFAALMVAGSYIMRRDRKGPKVVVLLTIGIYVAAVLAVSESPGLFARLTSLIKAPLEPLTDAEWSRWFFYLSPYFRILQFGLGSAAALAVMYCGPALLRSRVILRSCATLAVIALVGLHTQTFWPELLGRPSVPNFELLSSFLFAIIMINCTDISRINAFLSSRPLMFIGEISYSLYLFHPLSPRLGTWIGGSFSWTLFPNFVINFALTGFCALIFAFGMYRLVEIPAQRALRRLLDRRPATWISRENPVIVAGQTVEHASVPAQGREVHAARQANPA